MIMIQPKSRMETIIIHSCNVCVIRYDVLVHTRVITVISP